MLQKCRQILRNEKGLTLIELLAVVVILGIIAAIAVPSIGGLIDNTKKDAHVANAQQMANSAKLAITSDAKYQIGTWYITLGYLEDQKYIEIIKDPDTNNVPTEANADNGYYRGGKNEPNNNPPTENASYVTVTDGVPTHVKLVNNNGDKSRGVQSSSNPIPINSLTRNSVN